ncbi:hypothetical protein Nmel_013548 [Mimus melanotis]
MTWLRLLSESLAAPLCQPLLWELAKLCACSGFTLMLEQILSHACKRKEQEHGKDRGNTPKKPRLVFTDVQRRTLHAIFKENKRPSKELQITISQQLGLELSTVSNFFMNARRRSLDKWQDEGSSNSGNSSSSSSTCTKA